MLHGGMTRPDRRAAEGLFRSGAARVLLATDAAGEGLNLQEHCRTVVNFELPWNPIRLEQRVGRVDRIGQTRSVRAANIVARGTAEASVLHRLFERLRSIERSIGLSGDVLGRISEPLIQDLVLHEDVERLQPLLDGLVRRLGAPAPASQTALRTEETDGEVKRACLIRRLRAGTNVRIAHHSDILGSLARRGPWIAKRSRRRGRGGVAVMFTTPISDALQRVQETAFAPLFVAPRTTDSESANPVSVWTGLRAAHGDALERSAGRRTVQRVRTAPSRGCVLLSGDRETRGDCGCSPGRRGQRRCAAGAVRPARGTGKARR
jgi:hypothetical protein